MLYAIVKYIQDNSENENLIFYSVRVFSFSLSFSFCFSSIFFVYFSYSFFLLPSLIMYVEDGCGCARLKIELNNFSEERGGEVYVSWMILYVR